MYINKELFYFMKFKMDRLKVLLKKNKSNNKIKETLKHQCLSYIRKTFLFTNTFFDNLTDLIIIYRKRQLIINNHDYLLYIL